MIGMSKILLCVKTLTVKSGTFKEGETYKGSKVNTNWWVVDAIGVSASEFDEYFTEKQDEENEALDIVSK